MGPARRSIALLFLAALSLTLTVMMFAGATPARAQESSLAEQVRALAQRAEQGIADAAAGQPARAQATYDDLHAIWAAIEDRVRAQDPHGYAEIESALDQVKRALAAQPPAAAAIGAGYTTLRNELGEAAERLGAAAGLGAQVRGLTVHAREGIAAAEQGQPAIMRAEYEEIHTIWAAFEDRVAAQDAAGYVEIESVLAAIKQAVTAQPIDTAAVKAAFAKFETTVDQVADRVAGAAAVPIVAPAGSLPDALKSLDAAYAAIERGDVAGAQAQLDGFIRTWPSIEGPIAAKSQDAYGAVETEMGVARAALEEQPARLAAAEDAVERMRSALAPFAAERQTYTAFDAGLIILREGLEALLVIVALLAFLRRSGNADKRGWIWTGGALGVLASVVVAVILQTIFSSVTAGVNREVLEGVTGLVAATLLFYVSYWLHSKASLSAWKKYIDQRTTQALARGSMVGLALLAFLAVFREGAETAVFYLGMAPAIELRDLLLGMGAGVAILAVIAVLMLVVGVRLPLRPFFRVAGLLVYYLGFKFVGTGLHALQVAGALPTTPAPVLSSHPVFEFFGIYPTWQTLLPQIVLLIGALAVWFYLRAQDRRARSLGTAAPA